MEKKLKMPKKGLKSDTIGSIVYKQKRNINLDMVKIIACISVIGLHTSQKDISAFNAALYYLCGFAVPVFFMSSGYILLDKGGTAEVFIK